MAAIVDQSGQVVTLERVLAAARTRLKAHWRANQQALLADVENTAGRLAPDAIEALREVWLERALFSIRESIAADFPCVAQLATTGGGRARVGSSTRVQAGGRSARPPAN